LPVRLTPAEREGVNELVRRQTAALHSTGADVTAGSVVRGLIRRELLAQMIEGPIVPPPAPIQQSLFTATAPTSAPIVEPALVVDAAPIVDAVPIVETALVVEVAPIVDVALVVDVAPIVETSPARTDTADTSSAPERRSFRELIPGQERRAIADELAQMLGDPISRTSKAWWQYLGTVNALGPDVLREIAREALRIEEEGGLWTKDKSRRRTPGGIFFSLVQKRIGRKRDSAIHHGAQRSFERDMIERFLKFLAIVIPAAAAETVSASPVDAPEQPSPAAPVVEAAPVAIPLAPATPPSSRRPRALPALPEVIVVRRRVAPIEVAPIVEAAPVASTSPTKPSKASTSKASTSKAKPRR
jgi:hypothetical protein